MKSGRLRHMKKRFRTVLLGAGSVMSIFPATSYSAYVPKESAEQRMRDHWEAAGNHIKTATKEFDDQPRRAR